jgi:hypothetical protein
MANSLVFDTPLFHTGKFHSVVHEKQGGPSFKKPLKKQNYKY